MVSNERPARWTVVVSSSKRPAQRARNERPAKRAKSEARVSSSERSTRKTPAQVAVMEEPLEPPTRAQYETLHFIAGHGAPTIREIGMHFDIRTNAVSDRLDGLERRGFITRPTLGLKVKTRSITITNAGWNLLDAWRCPTCGERRLAAPAVVTIAGKRTRTGRKEGRR